ncbi:hypothetical protein DK846_03920 [Methanospirillum lacunae]|uniref:Thioredoxin domain-containing protein n=1 Tax=Methanospirillum lacunae TaxID=668570 RepID=A0A2V2N2F3_9EURY|nr:hypothetical protein DK846_03920 [Methanospirillum lacunae]
MLQLFYTNMIKILQIVLILILLLLIHPVSAVLFYNNGTDIPGAHLVEFLNNDTNFSSSPFPIQFFYNTHCGSCVSSVKFIDNFTIKHPDIGVEYHDLYNNTESFALYEEAKKQYNRSDLYYPVIFIGDIGIMGSPDIVTYTDLLTLWYQNHVKTDPLTEVRSWVRSVI